MKSNASPRPRQRGMSIIELLIGVVVGFIVVAGAVKLMVDTLGSNRRLLLETRVNQDLRAAADLIVRDIRRAGYWANSTKGIFTTTGSGTVVTNPYREISLVANEIKYRYARDVNDSADDPEQASFRLAGGVLQFMNGEGNWQAISDPKVVSITNLSITTSGMRLIELHSYCVCMTKVGATGTPECTDADFRTGAFAAKAPTLGIRHYDVVLAGQSATDATVAREIRETVRVRNERLYGCCPRTDGVQLCE